MQQGRPVAYLSKAFTAKQHGLSVYEKEMEARIFSVQKWKSYVVGRRFIIHTDHQSLRYLLQQKVHTPAQQRWLVKLMGFGFSLECKLGHHNRAAEALSRLYEEAFVDVITIVVPD